MKNSKQVVCPKCGGNEFFGTQRIYGYVAVVCGVDAYGDTIFLRNETADGLMDTTSLESDDPEGPFRCVQCNHNMEL